MTARRLAAWLFAVGLHSTWAQSQGFAPDMAAAKSFLSGFMERGVPAVQQQLYGHVDTSTVGAMGRFGATVQGHNAANTQAINDCVAAAQRNFQGLDTQAKINCHAIITAAGVTYTPNPYLDATNPKNLRATGTASSLRAAQSQQMQAVQTGAIESPTPFTTSTTNCTATQLQTPAVNRLDYCRAEKAVSPTTCTSTINATLQDGQIVTQEDKTACAAPASNPYCVAGGSSCTLQTTIATGQLDADGRPITQLVCVQQTYGYDCWDVNGPWDYTRCNSLASSCQPTGNTTPAQLVSGMPVWEDVEYSCTMQPATTQTANSCQTSICVGGTCFDATPQSSPDFGQAAVGLEILREAGVYSHGLDENSLRVFTGISNNCSRPTGPGIGTNCCQSSGGASLRSNRDVLPSLATRTVGSAVVAGGSYGLHQASNQMYDFMFTNGNQWMTEKAVDAWSAGLWNPNAGFNMKLSSFGFTMQIGGAGGAGSFVTDFLPDGATGVLKEVSNFWDTGTIWKSTELLDGNLLFSFNIYSLAAEVAVQVVVEMFSCSQDEKMLSVRRGGDLCMKTGEGCSRRLPWPLKTCIQITETYCCWNSQLAKLIAVQGGAQLGGGPRCGGFSPQELTLIDFSKIDFSGFIQQMLASTSLPDATYNTSTLTQASSRAVQGQTSITPSSAAAGVSDPALKGYVQGVVGGMLSK